MFPLGGVCACLIMILVDVFEHKGGVVLFWNESNKEISRKRKR